MKDGIPAGRPDMKPKSGAYVSPTKRRAIYERDGFSCLRCGNNIRPAISIDHVIPLAKGGSNELSNYQTLCKKCNQQKGTNVVDYRWHPVPEDWPKPYTGRKKSNLAPGKPLAAPEPQRPTESPGGTYIGPKINYETLGSQKR